MSDVSRTLRVVSALLAASAGGAACASRPRADTTALNGPEGDVVAGSGTAAGTYGNLPVAPILAAYWVGQPDDPAEAAGGPFIYLLSSAVTCRDLSMRGWLSRIPPETQVLELIVGTTTVGSAAAAATSAKANASEVNYLFGRASDEVRATAGTVTLTAYTKGVAVDGTMSLTFPSGSVAGGFHAVYCPGGQEESR